MPEPVLQDTERAQGLGVASLAEPEKDGGFPVLDQAVVGVPNQDRYHDPETH
jgi:hypothetical protein